MEVLLEDVSGDQLCGHSVHGGLAALLLPDPLHPHAAARPARE